MSATIVRLFEQYLITNSYEVCIFSRENILTIWKGGCKPCLSNANFMGESLYLLCEANIGCTDRQSATHIENFLYLLAFRKTNYLEKSIKICLEINQCQETQQRKRTLKYLCAKRSECRACAGLE